MTKFKFASIWSLIITTIIGTIVTITLLLQYDVTIANIFKFNFGLFLITFVLLILTDFEVQNGSRK